MPTMIDRTEKTSVPASDGLVSFVITTRNSRGTLKQCLESVNAQTYRNIEVIVIDNYSTDGTAEIAAELADVFATGGPERSAQRNLGAKLSAGEFVLFVDADMELTAKVTEDCMSRAGDCDAIIVPEITIGEGLVAEIRALERACYLGSYLFEAARFVRKSVFKSVGGFDVRLTGLEDYDFEAKLEERGCAVGHAAEPIHHIERNLDLGLYLRKRAYYSAGLALYRQLHTARARQQFGIARLRAYSTLLGRSPVRLAEVLTFKILEYMAVRISRLHPKPSTRENWIQIYAGD
jgi:glycosyltransferase involved in cell wall biosynthesis